MFRCMQLGYRSEYILNIYHDLWPYYSSLDQEHTCFAVYNLVIGVSILNICIS